MRIDRRMILVGSGALLVSRYAGAAAAEAAGEQNALFWQVTPPGRKGAVLFGYVRIAPAEVPDVVKDGEALVDASERMVIDMPQNVRFGTVGAARQQMKPLVQIVSPATADRLRKFISTTPAAALGEQISGLEATTLLMVEGQHNAAVTVGGTIFEHARSAGKPIDELLSDAEIRSAWQQPDLVALNGKIGEETVAYMFDLRDKVGPIGGYLEQLYRQRKADEIEHVTADMTRHGLVSPSQFLQTDKLRELMFERTMDLLTRQADETRFMTFPVGMLTGSSGLLAAFAAKGLTVTPRA
jgi:hypothetical protein